MFRTAWIGVLWGVPWLAAAAPGTVAQPAELRTAPRAAGTVLRRLAAGTAVELLHRDGGWYQVEVEHLQGWVRLAALRLRPLAAPDKPAAAALSAAELQKGNADLQAVAALDATAPSADDASDFAGRGGLEVKGVGRAPGPTAEQRDQPDHGDADKPGDDSQ